MGAGLSWRETEVDGQVVKWLPILEVGTSGLALGVSGDATWLVGDSNEAVRLSSGGSAGVRLLPLLERDPEPTARRIRDFVENAEISVDGGHDLPLIIAVKEALSGRSTYWAELALRWLEVIDVSPEILATLEGVSNEPWASQRLRHGAQKILFRERGSSRP